MASFKKMKNILKYSSFASVLNTNIFASSTSAKNDVTAIKKECEKLVEEIKKINGSCSISIPDNANSAKLTEIKKKLEEEKKSVISQRNALIDVCKSLIAECKKLDSQFNKTVNQNDTITNLNNLKGVLDKNLKDLKDKNKDKEKNPKEKEKEKEDENPKEENPEKDKENPVNPKEKEKDKEDENPKEENSKEKDKDPKEKEKEEFNKCVELLKKSWDFRKKVDALYKVSEDKLDGEIEKLKPEYDKIIKFEKKLNEEGKDEILGENDKTIINSRDLKNFFGYYHLLDDIKDKIKKDKEDEAKKKKEEEEKKAKEEAEEKAFKEYFEKLKANDNVKKNFEAFFKDFNGKLSGIYGYDYEIKKDDIDGCKKSFKEKVMVYFEEEYKIKKDEAFDKYLNRIEEYCVKFFTEYDDNIILNDYGFKNKEGNGSYRVFKPFFIYYINGKSGDIFNLQKNRL